MDAERGKIRAGMTSLGLILTNSSSIKEWNRIEHHRVRKGAFGPIDYRIGYSAGTLDSVIKSPLS